MVYMTNKTHRNQRPMNNDANFTLKKWHAHFQKNNHFWCLSFSYGFLYSFFLSYFYTASFWVTFIQFLSELLLYSFFLSYFYTTSFWVTFIQLLSELLLYSFFLSYFYTDSFWVTFYTSQRNKIKSFFASHWSILTFLSTVTTL